MSTPISTSDIQAIPEMVAYEQAKQMLYNFKAANPQFFEMLSQLTEQYNQTREAADKAVRALGVSCGDFDLYQKVDKVDGDKLLNALGRDLFIEIGGSIKGKSEAKIGHKQLQTAVARGVVDQELYNDVVKEEPRYHTPPECIVP